MAYFSISSVTVLEMQPRLGGNPLEFLRRLPPKKNCGSKRVNREWAFVRGQFAPATTPIRTLYGSVQAPIKNTATIILEPRIAVFEDILSFEVPGAFQH